MEGSSLKANLLENNAKLINKHLLEKISGNPKELYKAASHLVVNGGKRLRPFLVIKCCQVLGGKKKHALPAASAIEMIHNFTLVHDDIMDNDEIRHGVPTVHKKFSMPIAILAGDVLFSKAYDVISNSNLDDHTAAKLCSRLARACIDVCEGQVMDIKMAENKKIPNQAQYIKMVRKKTSALFDVSSSMGAICAKGTKNDIANMSSFGKNLGIAFQITDDLIGVMGDPKLTKKPVGNDLREGKKSLPILLALKKAKGKNRKKLLKVFGNKNSSKKDLKEAIEIIRSIGIESEVRKQALRYSSNAKKSLKKYSGRSKQELLHLLDFVVKRSL